MVYRFEPSIDIRKLGEQYFLSSIKTGLHVKANTITNILVVQKTLVPTEKVRDQQDCCASCRKFISIVDQFAVRGS